MPKGQKPKETVFQEKTRKRNLDQLEMVTGAISALNQLLVEKGVITQNELEGAFWRWMDEHHPESGSKGKRK